MIMASFLIIALMGLIIGHSSAYEFYVGGIDGWVQTPKEEYNLWSARMRFQVNDTIVFKYKKGEDSVLVVTKDDYNTCNTRNPVQKYDDGNTILKFDRSGPFFYISGASGHCENGQKLIVVVLAIRNKKGQTPPPMSSPPSPSSSPLPTPSFSPLPSPLPTPSFSPLPTPSSSPLPTPSSSPIPSPSFSPLPTPSSSPIPSPSFSPLPSPFGSPTSSPPTSSPSTQPPSESPSSEPPSPAGPTIGTPTGAPSAGSTGNETTPSPPSSAPAAASWTSGFFIGVFTLLLASFVGYF